MAASGGRGGAALGRSGRLRALGPTWCPPRSRVGLRWRDGPAIRALQCRLRDGHTARHAACPAWRSASRRGRNVPRPTCSVTVAPADPAGGAVSIEQWLRRSAGPRWAQPQRRAGPRTPSGSGSVSDGVGHSTVQVRGQRQRALLVAHHLRWDSGRDRLPTTMSTRAPRAWTRGRAPALASVSCSPEAQLACGAGEGWDRAPARSSSSRSSTAPPVRLRRAARRHAITRVSLATSRSPSLQQVGELGEARVVRGRGRRRMRHAA